MHARLVYASSGEAIAFLEDRNVFTMEGIWVGVTPDYSAVYDTTGKYIGLFLNDGRIAINSTKQTPPSISPPPPAIARELPYTIPLRPPLPHLPAPYAEAVLMASDSSSRRVNFSIVAFVIVVTVAAYIVYSILQLGDFGKGEITTWTRSDWLFIFASLLYGLTLGYALKGKFKRHTSTKLSVLLVGTTGNRAAVIRHLGNFECDIPTIEVDSEVNPVSISEPLVRSLAQPNRHGIVILANALDPISGRFLPTFSLAGGDRKLASRIFDIPKFAEHMLGRILVNSTDELYNFKKLPNTFQKAFIKRVFDIVVSSGLLLFAAPTLFITAALIYLESGGPILYSQKRVGLNGKSIRLLKFRTMRTTESHVIPVWASDHDNRVTRIGRMIRRLRIDELPQLFNVLKGDLSIVGPRPERHYFVQQLTKEIPSYHLRNLVKPGITGWAQVRYYYGSTIEKVGMPFEYDLYYVKNNSIFLDIIILIETIAVVMVGR